MADLIANALHRSFDLQVRLAEMNKIALMAMQQRLASENLKRKCRVCGFECYGQADLAIHALKTHCK